MFVLMEMKVGGNGLRPAGYRPMNEVLEKLLLTQPFIVHGWRRP